MQLLSSLHPQEKLAEGKWEVGREGWTALHAFRNMLAGGEGSVEGRAGRNRSRAKKRTQRGRQCSSVCCIVL